MTFIKNSTVELEVLGEEVSELPSWLSESEESRKDEEKIKKDKAPEEGTDGN